MDAQPQLDLFAARAERDAGVERSARRANRNINGWTETAYLYLEKYARERALFSSEEVTVWASGEGLPKPTDLRSWGAVYLRAQRSGVIKRSEKTYHRAFGHATIGHYWESLTCGR